MIEVVAENPDTVTMCVTVRQLAVYLDNWATVALAKGRGSRFVALGRLTAPPD
jgi:hypothetical protein